MGLFGCFHRKKKDKNKNNDKSSQESSKSSVSSGRATQRSSSPNTLDDSGMPFSPRAYGTGDVPHGDMPHGDMPHDDMPHGGTPSSPGASSRRQQQPHFTENDALSRISEGPTWTSSTAPNYHSVPPPSAREAAFHGPPRFDWIDIETAAATKIQSVYRKNKTMTELEKNGMSTSAIRNRKRRHKAAKANHGPKVTQSADTPSFFQCCAVGLAFGEATEDDEEAYRRFQKKKYEERVEQQQMHEDALRKQYLRANGAGSAPGKILEVLEVVE